MIEELDLNGLEITSRYDDYRINNDVPLVEQIWELKEDIIQLEFNHQYIVDLGYYPSHSENGEFKILLIFEQDWTKPVLEKTCKTPDRIKVYLQEAIDKVKNMSKID